MRPPELTVDLGQIDRSLEAPAYAQIAGRVREAILASRLEPGDPIPSESQLIAHFGVARMTVRQALGKLRTEGLVIAQQGRGVFVASEAGMMEQARLHESTVQAAEELAGAFTPPRRRGRSRSEPVVTQTVNPEVMEAAQRLLRPGTRLRIIDAETIIIEND